MLKMLTLTNVEDILRVKNQIKDSDTRQILDLVVSNRKNVSVFLKAENPDSLNISEGMCLEVSRFFNNILKEHGFHPTVLQGEIEIEKNDWLEHHVSFIRLPHHWLTIDFAPNQIARHNSISVLVLILEPEKTSLRFALKKVYNWWTPDS